MYIILVNYVGELTTGSLGILAMADGEVKSSNTNNKR